MNEEGYTLTEMLAALLMIGLAVGGLTQVVRLIGSAQVRTSERLQEARTLRAAEGRLTAMLSRGGPYRSTGPGFTGDAHSMRFACGEAEPCAARLSPAGAATKMEVKGAGEPRSFTAPVADVRFIYQGDAAEPAWPPEGPRQTLRAVHLVGAGEQLVFTSRLWREQPAECAFDSISRDCRETAP